MFDLDRSQTHEWMHGLQPVLEAALGDEMALPERKLRSIEAFMEQFPGVERVMIDGTERPIQRPQDADQGVPIAFGSETTLRNFSQTTDKF